MIWAHNRKGQSIQAYPNGKGFCPSCNDGLVPKCGKVKIWHWSHKASHDCDLWSEGETDWHLWWKSLIPNPQKYTEVVMTDGDSTHRADCVSEYNGGVIEFQHSSISEDDMLLREGFYKEVTGIPLTWVFDAQPFFDNFEIYRKPHHFIPFEWPDGADWVARWKYARHHLIERSDSVYLDTQDAIFNILKIEDVDFVDVKRTSHFDSDKLVTQTQIWVWGKRLFAHQLLSLWNTPTWEHIPKRSHK